MMRVFLSEKRGFLFLILYICKLKHIADIFMDLNLIKQNLLQALALVDDMADAVEDTTLVRDLAMEKVRRAYEELRFGSASVTVEELAPVAAVAEAAIVADQSVDGEVGSDEEPEIEVEFILPDDEADDEHSDEVVVEVEDAAENEPEEVEFVADEEPAATEPIVEEKPADKESATEGDPVATEPVADNEESYEDDSADEESFMGLPQIEALPIERPTVDASLGSELSLFGDDEAVERKSRKARRNIIRSLYEEDVPAVAVPQPQIEEVVAEVPQTEEGPEEPQNEPPQVVAEAVVEPIESEVPLEEPQRVLGEVLGGDVQVLGDAVSAQPSISDSLPLVSICDAVGVADRYMLARELFDGDTKACEEALKALDAIDNFDDCMVYIVENYSWLPTSNGARLVVDLLQRKFQ